MDSIFDTDINHGFEINIRGLAEDIYREIHRWTIVVIGVKFHQPRSQGNVYSFFLYFLGTFFPSHNKYNSQAFR